MAKVQIYRPCPVKTPRGLSVQKCYPRLHTVDAEHRHKIDFNTIFYDVFWDAASHRIQGIGPKILNLRKDYLPLSITVSGQSVSFRLRKIKDLIFLETESINWDYCKVLEIKFCFKDFSQTVDIDVLQSNRSVPQHRCVKHRLLTLTTLQKDNPIEWIGDWITWYYKSYGVDRLVLYDNGSSSKEAVIELLQKLTFDLEIIFVDWDFPHGFHPYKYCQRGSLNHCRIRFANGGYCLNFDIDEYLMCTQNNLIDYLDQTLRYPRPGSVAVQEVKIVDVPPETDEKPLRCWHFKYRRRKWGGVGKTKYIYRFDDVGYNSVHTTDSEKNLAFCKRYSLMTLLFFAFKRISWEAIKKLKRSKQYKPRIDMIHADASEIFYFHFYGLHTGWSRHGGLPKSPEEFNSRKHRIESRVKQIEIIARESGFESKRHSEMPGQLRRNA